MKKTIALVVGVCVAIGLVICIAFKIKNSTGSNNNIQNDLQNNVQNNVQNIQDSSNSNVNTDSTSVFTIDKLNTNLFHLDDLSGLDVQTININQTFKLDNVDISFKVEKIETNGAAANIYVLLTNNTDKYLQFIFDSDWIINGNRCYSELTEVSNSENVYSLDFGYKPKISTELVYTIPQEYFRSYQMSNIVSLFARLQVYSYSFEDRYKWLADSNKVGEIEINAKLDGNNTIKHYWDGKGQLVYKIDDFELYVLGWTEAFEGYNTGILNFLPYIWFYAINTGEHGINLVSSGVKYNGYKSTSFSDFEGRFMHIGSSEKSRDIGYFTGYLSDLHSIEDDNNNDELKQVEFLLKLNSTAKGINYESKQVKFILNK